MSASGRAEVDGNSFRELRTIFMRGDMRALQAADKRLVIANLHGFKEFSNVVREQNLPAISIQPTHREIEHSPLSHRSGRRPWDLSNRLDNIRRAHARLPRAQGRNDQQGSTPEAR